MDTEIKNLETGAEEQSAPAEPSCEDTQAGAPCEETVPQAAEEQPGETAPAEPEPEEPENEEAPESLEQPEEEPIDEPSEESEEEPIEEEASEEEDLQDEEHESLSAAVLNALRDALIWIVLVAVLLLGIVGGVSFWLYENTSEEVVPHTVVTFGGQQVEPVKTEWNATVLGPIHRTFKTQSSEQQLQTVETVSPGITAENKFTGTITVTNENGQTVYDGSTEDFSYFTFTQNGRYSAHMVMSKTEPGITGQNEYEFGFTLSARPVLSISRESVPQGSAFSLVVSGGLGEIPPRLQAEFSPEATFVQVGSKWVALLDVPIDCKTGDYDLTVTAGDHTIVQPVRVYARQIREIDTSSLDGTADAPYIGAMPAGIAPYMDICDPDAYWASGFVQPVKGSLVRDYYVDEYMNRIKDPVLMELVPDLVAAYNAEIHPRLSMNVTYSLPAGTKVKCPADGRVVFVGTVNGGGRTLVIEHGGGLKSIFYLLSGLYCSEGDFVYKEDVVATTNDHVICEMRLNGSSISPWDLWRNMGGITLNG